MKLDAASIATILAGARFAHLAGGLPTQTTNENTLSLSLPQHDINTTSTIFSASPLVTTHSISGINSIQPNDINLENIGDITAQIKKAYLPHIARQTPVNITSQEELNALFKTQLKQFINNKDINCPQITWQNIVDLKPYIDKIVAQFPELDNSTFSLKQACDYALKENCNDYANREQISKDKNTKRLVKIIVPPVILGPLAITLILSMCCCGSVAILNRLFK